MCDCNPPNPVQYGNTDGVYCKDCGEMLDGSVEDWDLQIVIDMYDCGLNGHPWTCNCYPNR